MRIKSLCSGKFCVATVFDAASQRAEITAFLSGVESQYEASAKGLDVLFNRYAQHGRNGLTIEQFHEANKKERIWEFTKGRLRVYCFLEDDGNVLLLSHGIVKKNQKAKSADIERAAALRDRYIRAKQAGNLSWEKSE